MLDFRKPIAQIYVSEMRRRLDKLVVPIFPPDTTVDVGDFGSFEDGRFVRRGNLADRDVHLSVDENKHAGYNFASDGKFEISPSAKVPNPLGGELLEATLKFTRGKAVVASFRAGVDRAVADADAFADTLAELWASKKLRTDRAVVWSVRKATGGTIVVSKEGGNQVKLVADSALLGLAGITLAGLSAGVQFGAETGATWKMSDPKIELVLWARLYRLDSKTAQAVDAFAFEPGSPELAAQAKSIKPTGMPTDDVLAQLKA
jgi:hypothetical protein